MTKKQRRQMRSRERRKSTTFRRAEIAMAAMQAAKQKMQEVTPAPAPKPKYNTECNFCSVRDGRCYCKIKMDTFFCSSKCAYATNNPGALPPYGTKYMKGGKL